MSAVSVAPCVFCEVTNVYEDKVGVWCPRCHKCLRIKWA